ncbi:two-component sensor histidine kinase [[Clostridium] sordellii]|uniref:sensor histidine kinase n=1 Tax=Paraclostridium sordellii TaxID=1505 RepID=UPI0005E27816|nr:ATP-binding protein [Paeniclostridium sordellii]CEP46560.1 two-component sensor histidine kinase [[Clostridium] sordellii] [Paeniclostridium sordellii]
MNNNRDFNLINICSIIVFMFFIFLVNVLIFRTESNYLLSTLTYIRIFNIILSITALCGCFIIYIKSNNSVLFILSLMYLCFSIGMILGNIDYFIFDNSKFMISNYINVPTSILRISILFISILPNSKIHKNIINNRTKSIIFIVLYSLIFGFINIHALFYNSNNFFILYNMFLFLSYFIISIRLFKLSSKNDDVMLKLFGISIILLSIKAIIAIYGFFYVSFNIKLISVSITSLFFLVIIVAVGIKLYISINKSKRLNADLFKFFNFVENNNYSYMFICDYNLNVSYINKKIKEYYGHDINNEKFKKDLLKNKELYTKLEYIFKNLNENGFWKGIIRDIETNEILDCYVQSLDIDSKQNNEILVSYIDISEYIKLESDLESYKLKNIKKDEFISNISHELKTPLNIFYSTIQLLDRLTLENEINFKEKFNDYSSSLKLNCKRMLRLISNIVDISRIDLGVLNPEYINYNIVSLIEEISLSAIPYAKAKDIYIEFDTNVEEHYIKCDPNIIEKILLNLISNAIKYSNRHSNIYISTEVLPNYTKISVKDEGIGIDDSIKENIFDKFIRADNTFTRLNEGCGLGLSIVKSMVEIHNGTISLESTLNKGSIFEVKIPNTVIENYDPDKHTYSNSNNVEMELSDIYEIHN